LSWRENQEDMSTGLVRILTRQTAFSIVSPISNSDVGWTNEQKVFASPAFLGPVVGRSGRKTNRQWLYDKSFVTVELAECDKRKKEMTTKKPRETNKKQVD
jgi:hypothetical protein